MLPYAAASWRALTQWEPQYAPTAEQAALDRLAAYEAGVPHGARRRPESEAARVVVCTLMCSSPCRAALGPGQPAKQHSRQPQVIHCVAQPSLHVLDIHT